MSNIYLEHLQQAQALLQADLPAPVSGSAKATPQNLKPDVPTVLICAPHPDDECLMGGLALRLQQECGWQVAVYPLTLGSNSERRAARLKELQQATAHLGWSLLEAGEAHYGINMGQVIEKINPALILLPHAADGHPTHIDVHQRVMAALAHIPNFNCILAESEYWQSLPQPNLLLALADEQAAQLLAALCAHVGEVARNPYHLRYAAWLMDNVRRGSERVKGQGQAAAAFAFGQLYQLRLWQQGQIKILPARVLDSSPLSEDLFKAEKA